MVHRARADFVANAFSCETNAQHTNPIIMGSQHGTHQPLHIVIITPTNIYWITLVANALLAKREHSRRIILSARVPDVKNEFQENETMI